MKKTHTVLVEDLSSWQQDAKILYASSTQENKQLYATCSGSYEVWHNKELVLKTTLPVKACNKYNSIEN